MQEMARSRPVELKGARSFKSLVLHETDRLSKEAQHSLRRTMEKYTAACRLVLICNNVSKVSASTHLHSMLGVVWERSASQCRVQCSIVLVCSTVCELAVVIPTLGGNQIQQICRQPEAGETAGLPAALCSWTSREGSGCAQHERNSLSLVAG